MCKRYSPFSGKCESRPRENPQPNIHLVFAGMPSAAARKTDYNTLLGTLKAGAGLEALKITCSGILVFPGELVQTLPGIEQAVKLINTRRDAE